MRVTPARSNRLLALSLSTVAGIALGVLAVQGCGSGTTGKVGDPCGQGSPCGSGLACVSGTCQAASQADGGSGDGGATCGTAPVSNCGPCADGTACTDDGNSCTSDLCASGQCTHPPVASGTACGTSGKCDASGNCSQGCTIGGQFYADGTGNPNESCQLCDVSRSSSSWSYRPDGTSCPDDGNACTQDLCNAGACTHPAVATGTSCGTGKVCDSSNTCTAGCYIGGQIYADGAANPANPCQTCNAAQSTTGWSDAAAGASCGSGMVCNASNQCVAGCYINGTMYTTGASNPSDSCQACQPSSSTSAWTTKAAGSTCASDNNPCTLDICERSNTNVMACSHPPVNNGGNCGTGKVCSAGSCLSGCYIGGTYYAANATNSSNVCQICKPLTSTTGWSSNNGVSCNDGNPCTKNDVCNNQTCAGTPYQCRVLNGNCQYNACDGNGGCVITNSPAGTACSNSNCGTTGFCNSSGICDRCNASGTSCCVTGRTYSCQPSNAIINCN